MCLESKRLLGWIEAYQHENGEETFHVEPLLEENYSQQTFLFHTRSSFVEAQLEEDEVQRLSLERCAKNFGETILTLVDTERLDFPGNVEPYRGRFWSSQPINNGLNESIRVSHYYTSNMMQMDDYFVKTEACTIVVGGNVVLPIELFLDESDLFVYKDILTDFNTTLGGALEIFSESQGFKRGTRYTYLKNDHDIWKDFHISEHILKMKLCDVLLRNEILECNAADYFRLSPYDVDENFIMKLKI